MNPAGNPVFSPWLCCSISSLSVWAKPDCGNKKLTLQLRIKPSSLCNARSLLCRDKVVTFGSSTAPELMIITSQMQNQGNEHGASRRYWRDVLPLTWHQLWAEGQICYLVPTATSVLLWALSLCFHCRFLFQSLIYRKCWDWEKQGNAIQPTYLALGSGFCSLLPSKVREDWTHELWYKADEVSPGVYYLLCVYQTQPMNSPILLYFKNNNNNKKKK